MTSGLAATRLPALQTCQERGWKEGTILVSKEWIAPMRIVTLLPRPRLVRVQPPGTQVKKPWRGWYPSFPGDISEYTSSSSTVANSP